MNDILHKADTNNVNCEKSTKLQATALNLTKNKFNTKHAPSMNWIL